MRERRRDYMGHAYRLFSLRVNNPTHRLCVPVFFRRAIEMDLTHAELRGSDLFRRSFDGVL
jgi:hypothetical protein